MDNLSEYSKEETQEIINTMRWFGLKEYLNRVDDLPKCAMTIGQLFGHLHALEHGDDFMILLENAEDLFSKYRKIMTVTSDLYKNIDPTSTSVDLLKYIFEYSLRFQAIESARFLGKEVGK